MITTRTYKPIIAAAVAVLAFAAFLFIPKPAKAELIVSPPKFDYSAKPGDVLRGTLLFKNGTVDDAKIFPSALNFTHKEGDEVTGSPVTYAADEVRTGTELAPWIEYDPEPFEVKAGASFSMPYTIRIPRDAQPGGHFGIIELLVGHPGVDKTGVGVTGGLGSLIFLKVEGDVVEDLTLEQFSSDAYSYRHLPVFFTARMKNGGNTHLRPVGNIFIKDMFGREIAVLTINPTFQTILPNSTRRFETHWVKNRPRNDDSALQKEMRNFAFGKYEATAFINYGDGKTATATYDFVVIPWFALGVWALIILAVVLVLVFGLKAYNKMVIRKYQKMQK